MPRNYLELHGTLILVLGFAWMSLGFGFLKTQYDAIASAGAYPMLSNASLLTLGAISAPLGLTLRLTGKGIGRSR